MGSNKESVDGKREQQAQIVQTLANGQVQLACQLDASDPNDSVSLILFYKDNSMVPIFR